MLVHNELHGSLRGLVAPSELWLRNRDALSTGVHTSLPNVSWSALPASIARNDYEVVVDDTGSGVLRTQRAVWQTTPVDVHHYIF